MLLAGLLRKSAVSWAFFARGQHFQRGNTSNAQPVQCLDQQVSNSLEQAIECLDAYTVSMNRYNRMTYDAAQPNAAERLAWRNVIYSLINAEGDCSSVKLPAALTNIYTVSLFVEPSKVSYCVLSELNGEGMQYAKGWGTFVVPAGHGSQLRNIHLSAPHPAFDLDTPAQAASLFKSTRAKSLLIAGRSRQALLEPTDCIHPTTGDVYYTTDPAHNKEEPFYDAVRSIFTWQTENGGCHSASCAFIQLHGKAASTCPEDQIFLSAGLGTGAASRKWYTDSVPRPVKQLKHQLQLAFPAWNISLPSDSSCSLTATTNVVGRFLNGIPDELVCSTPSNASLASGFFVHVEQAIAARGPEAYDGWSKALINAFDVGD